MDVSRWTRLEHDGTPVYIRPDTPDWFIPNAAGDALLRTLTERGPAAGDHTLADWPARRFLSVLASPPTEPYAGRKDCLDLDGLEECWLHITDRCNLACRHCLFACSPQTRQTLSGETALRAIEQAYALGARTFYLTGGEPTVHPDFADICRAVLEKYADTRLVLLTNGLLLPEWSGLFQSLPEDRLFLQVSVDGIGETHDRLRGRGAYDRLLAGLAALAGGPAAVTLSMAVHAANYTEMPALVDLAAEHGCDGVHYMWLLITGKAAPGDFVNCDALFTRLADCRQRGERQGVTIDNLRNLASRVFATPGTRHDLSNAGWTSLAVGPDGRVYPTPALIGQADLDCGSVDGGDLEDIWRNSPVLADLRGRTLLEDAAAAADPLRFLIGGDDIDHSYYAGGDFVGHDPYRPLYRRLALWLMADSAGLHPAGETAGVPRVRRKMGEKLLQCHHDGRGVALTHSNCVLTLAGTHQVVGDFYAAADQTDNTDILNPVCYPQAEVDHIPAAGRIRSYGCGSPVLDAGITTGEVVVDLGAGAGVECFIAARKTGPAGWVVGLDMLDPMLERADRTRPAVADNLGYANVEFKKGFLEAVPLADDSVDAVISNCVINLSEDKRQTFAEVFRVLKPGGRICVSDVVTDSPCPPSIQNDPSLRGECIAGALVQPHLMAMLEAVGFVQIRVAKRFFYREVQGHLFYSLTYTARKPSPAAERPVMYPGPYAAVVMDNGRVLVRGETDTADWSEPAAGDASIFLLDNAGSVVNIAAVNTCACGPETAPAAAADSCDCGPAPAPSAGSAGSTPITPHGSPRSMSDCMVCGKPLSYLGRDRKETCLYCGRTLLANAVCAAGHFVCDACHGGDMVEIVKQVCTHTTADDLIDLMNELRRHPAFPVNGPEHHFAVPGVILAVYRNRGGAVSEEDIVTAIDRGKQVPGGVCAFWGACGAAVGVGIAFGVMLQSTPLTPLPRQQVQQITEAVIARINAYEAARCCQRESWTALRSAAEMSRQYLPVRLPAEGDARCRQQAQNRECARQDCPYFQEQAGSAGAVR